MVLGAEIKNNCRVHFICFTSFRNCIQPCTSCWLISADFSIHFLQFFSCFLRQIRFQTKYMTRSKSPLSKFYNFCFFHSKFPSVCIYVSLFIRIKSLVIQKFSSLSPISKYIAHLITFPFFWLIIGHCIFFYFNFKY